MQGQRLSQEMPRTFLRLFDMIPDKIYTDNRGAYAERPVFSQIDANIEYIRKDAILEWLDGKMTIEGATEGIVGGYDMAMKDVINKLNSI